VRKLIVNHAGASFILHPFESKDLAGLYVVKVLCNIAIDQDHTSSF
jgi:hypothetical protein